MVPPDTSSIRGAAGVVRQGPLTSASAFFADPPLGDSSGNACGTAARACWLWAWPGVCAATFFGSCLFAALAAGGGCLQKHHQPPFRSRQPALRRAALAAAQAFPHGLYTRARVGRELRPQREHRGMYV